MRSKGSRVALGVWGLRVCSLDPHMAVPLGNSTEVVIFGGFQGFVASFRVAGVALCDIQMFSEDVLQFSWQVQYFGRVHRYFSWQV